MSAAHIITPHPLPQHPVRHGRAFMFEPVKGSRDEALAVTGKAPALEVLQKDGGGAPPGGGYRTRGRARAFPDRSSPR